jgi:hypothetical protein
MRSKIVAATTAVAAIALPPLAAATEPTQAGGRQE